MRGTRHPALSGSPSHSSSSSRAGLLWRPKAAHSCRRSEAPFCHTPLALPLRQLGDLNDVAAGIVHLRNGRAGYRLWRHRELAAARLNALAVSLDVVGKEHDCGLVLL